MTGAVLLLHLLGFAAFVGAGFAQQRLLARSRAAGLAAAARDELERLSASVVTKIELPAILVSVASGVVAIVLAPDVMTHAWMHAKLTCVVLLLVLSHVEMFNARRIVKLRAGALPAPDAAAAIEARKRRHAIFGAVGSVLVLAILLLVVFRGRL